MCTFECTKMEAGWFFKGSAKPAKSYRVILTHLRFELTDAGSGHWIVTILFSVFSELMILSAVALCCVLRWFLLDSNSFLLAHPLCYWNLSLTSFHYHKLMKTLFSLSNQNKSNLGFSLSLKLSLYTPPTRLHFLLLPKQVYQLGSKHSNTWVCCVFLIQTTTLFHIGVVWMYLTLISS